MSWPSWPGLATEKMDLQTEWQLVGIQRGGSFFNKINGYTFRASNSAISVFIRPFEKRSYYVIPLGIHPSVCQPVRKLFSFPCNSSYSLRPIELKLGVYSKAMRWFNAYYLEVMVQRFLAELQPFN